MKITIAQLRNIIKEETDGLLREAGRWNRGSYRVGSSDDPHDTRNYSTRNPDRDYERWFEKGDVPMPGGSDEWDEEDDEEERGHVRATVDPNAIAIRDFLRTVFDQPEYTWADFDSEHYMVLKGVLKNRKDENREELKQAAEAHGLDWKYLLVDIDWIVRGYGMPKTFIGLEDALKAQGQS